MPTLQNRDARFAGWYGGTANGSFLLALTVGDAGAFLWFWRPRHRALGADRLRVWSGGDLNGTDLIADRLVEKEWRTRVRNPGS